MARKQCFLLCSPSENMAIGNNVSWFVHLQKIWQGNNVSWFVHLQKIWLGNNVSWFAHLQIIWLGNNVSWFAHLQKIWLGNNVSWFAHLQKTWLGNDVSATIFLIYSRSILCYCAWIYIVHSVSLQEAVAEKYFSGTNMRKDAVILSTNQLRQSLHIVRVGIYCIFQLCRTMLVYSKSKSENRHPDHACGIKRSYAWKSYPTWLRSRLAWAGSFPIWTQIDNNRWFQR
jgi:hypothetical protein